MFLFGSSSSRDGLKVSETRDTIVFISMQNLQDVKVLNRDRDTVPSLVLQSVLVVCIMPYGYKNKHNAASGCSYVHIWRIVDDSWCLSMWSEQVGYLNLEVGWMDQVNRRIRVPARFEAEAYRDLHAFLLYPSDNDQNTDGLRLQLNHQMSEKHRTYVIDSPNFGWN